MAVRGELLQASGAMTIDELRVFVAEFERDVETYRYVACQQCGGVREIEAFPEPVQRQVLRMARQLTSLMEGR